MQQLLFAPLATKICYAFIEVIIRVHENRQSHGLHEQLLYIHMMIILNIVK